MTCKTERVLAQTEKPANIVRRRLEQAGYDAADGLDMLGAQDIYFLMKFVYKSNVLGPTVSDAVYVALTIACSRIISGGQPQSR